MNKAPSSSSRSPDRRGVRRGVLLAAVLAFACLAVLLVRRGVAPVAPGVGAPAAAARGPRSAPPVQVAARPRAGIAGHVLDPARNPVAGAQVCAWAPRGRGLVTAEIQAPRCTKADRAGAYALDDLFPATPLVVSASAPRFAPVGYRGPNGEGEIRLADKERRAAVDLVFVRSGVPLRGSVDDLTGGVVAGAFVVSEVDVDRAVAMSDAKGEFTLWVEPGRVSVSATATGYAPGWASGPAPDHFFKIHLVPGATLVGRAVIAGEETPVAGVFIEGIQVEGGWARASTRTDDEGRFRVEGLAPGRYRVEATSEGREGYSRSSVTLAMGETSAEVLIALDPAYVVRGRVVDKATGEPCPGGQVTLTDHKQNEFSQALIEPDGWARLASVIPGTYRVEVSCKGHVDRDDYPTVTLKDRDAPPLTWEVDKGASVRVQVVDGQGRPVTKVSVSAYATAPNGSSGSAERAEPDGTFVVSGLKPGAYNVSASATEGGRADQVATLALDREERIKLELPASGSIEGVVEDDAHRPVPNVQLVASGPSHTATRSLDDGTFTLTGLASGEYEVRPGDRWARRGSPDAPEVAVTKVTVAAPDHARVRVTVEARNGTIEGRVTDGTDKPVTDAFVDFALAPGGGDVPRYGRSSGQPVLTDTEGRFTIEGLADGEYSLRAHRNGGTEASVEHVKVGARDVAIKLGAGGSIAGSVAARGAPVERFTLRARQTAGSFTREELFFHAGGLFALGDLPAGAYEVSAETPDGTATTTFTLAEGEQKTGIALTLTLRGAVEGRLVALEGGAPIAGVRLGVDGSSSVSILTGDDRNNQSGADGRFHLEGVLPGQWSLTVYPSDPAFASVTVPITVQEGGGVSDVGAVRVPRARLGPGEMRGDLGVYADGTSGEVRGVSSAGAEAGIVAGDVIVSVDGFDVQAGNRYLYQPLTIVAAGRTVSFGLARGGTVSVVAGSF